MTISSAFLNSLQSGYMISSKAKAPDRAKHQLRLVDHAQVLILVFFRLLLYV